MSQDWSFKEEEVGEILMKEEIKEEDLEDESSHNEKNRESLNFQKKDLANVNNQTGIQNCLQKKMRYPTPIVVEAGVFSQSESPLFHGKGKLKKKSRTNKKHFRCIFYPYRAAQMVALKKHERTYMCDKPFKCSLCPYQAPQMEALKTHERTHTKEKPYKCTNCNYQAAQMARLKRHTRTHTGENPFKCSFCPYKAAEKNYS